MANIEKPRQGWEGLNNGGEIYGGISSPEKEI